MNDNNKNFTLESFQAERARLQKAAYVISPKPLSSSVRLNSIY